MTSHLFIARTYMAALLGFHIIFAVAGMAMPLLMVIAEGRWLARRDPVDRMLAKRWARGTTILFGVGAVSGTVLSFALGLLWPGFMRHAGPIIGMPFSLEGFAFFMEAIFLGIYLYGWDRVGPRMHWIAGVLVAISGTLSGVFVVTANAWMNTPAGFRVVDGQFVDIDPFAAMWNPAAVGQCLHMVLAAFAAIGMAVAAIHAVMLRREPGNRFHRRAFGIALAVGAAASLLQPLSGDLLAKRTAQYQPIKLAAMEGQWETRAGAPLRIGGWPDERTETTPYAIEIPWLLSFLAYGDPHAVVHGLKETPPEDRPPVAVVHVAFQIMVAAGTIMACLAVLAVWHYVRRRSLLTAPWYLRAVAWSGALGFIAIEAGWIVTEVGRQPWIIYKIMRTAEAVTPAPHLHLPFALFMVIYGVLGATAAMLLRYHVFASPTTAEVRNLPLEAPDAR